MFHAASDGSDAPRHPGHRNRGCNPFNVMSGRRKRSDPKADPTLLLPKCSLEVAYVLLGLLEQRAQCLGDIGKTEVHGLAEPIPVPIELGLLEAEVSRQGVAATR